MAAGMQMASVSKVETISNVFNVSQENAVIQDRELFTNSTIRSNLLSFNPPTLSLQYVFYIITSRMFNDFKRSNISKSASNFTIKNTL